MKSIKIGITFNTGAPIDQLIWCSGLNQNIVFYYDMFKHMGHDVCMLVSDNHTADELTIQEKKYNTITATKAIVQSMPFDLIIEAGLSIPHEIRQQLRENCDARIIAARFGNAAMIDSEELFIHRKETANSTHYHGLDMVWACPHHYRQAGYWELLYGAPIRPAPFVWEPHFVQKRHWDTDIPEKRDIIFPDPSFSVVKNMLIPLLITNQFLSEYDNISSVGKIRMMNSAKFADKDYFRKNFIDNLPFLKKTNILCEGRIRFEEIFTRPDVMVAWQHVNDLNYMYYEALYAGIPLVHNADLHKHVGFYYQDTDIKTATKHLHTIFNGYDRQAERKKNQAFLDTASIYDPIIQQRYATLLEEAISIPINT